MLQGATTAFLKNVPALYEAPWIWSSETLNQHRRRYAGTLGQDGEVV